MTEETLLKEAYGKVGWLKVNGTSVIPDSNKVALEIAKTFIPDLIQTFNEQVPYRKLWIFQPIAGTSQYSLPTDCDQILEVFRTVRNGDILSDPFYYDFASAHRGEAVGGEDLVDSLLRQSFVWKGIESSLDPGFDYDIIEGKLHIFQAILQSQVAATYRKAGGWTLTSIPDSYTKYLAPGLAAEILNFYVSSRESVPSTMKIVGGSAGSNREGATRERVKELEKSFQDGLEGLNKRQFMGLRIA